MFLLSPALSACAARHHISANGTRLRILFMTTRSEIACTWPTNDCACVDLCFKYYHHYLFQISAAVGGPEAQETMDLLRD